MATTNVQATTTWLKIAENTVPEFLVTWDIPVTLEFATTDTNVAPIVQGHRLTRESAITRSVIGPGYVWVRVTATNPTKNALLVLSK